MGDRATLEVRLEAQRHTSATKPLSVSGFRDPGYRRGRGRVRRRAMKTVKVGEKFTLEWGSGKIIVD